MESITDVATFWAQFEIAMQTLKAKSPKVRTYVVSIPNVYYLRSLLKDNSSARSTWALFGVCQSLLANPLSTAQADIDRRNAVYQRNVELNTVLGEVCATNTRCKFDNNAVLNTAFTASDVSTIDYFHPSLAGQAKLAGIAWNTFGLVKP